MKKKFDLDLMKGLESYNSKPMDLTVTDPETLLFFERAWDLRANADTILNDERMKLARVPWLPVQNGTLVKFTTLGAFIDWWQDGYFGLIYKESLKLALDVVYDEINLENDVITLCEKVISGGSFTIVHL